MTLDQARQIDFTKSGNFARFMTLAREPWREYCPFAPDDMPPKRGDERALARLSAECGEYEEKQ